MKKKQGRKGKRDDKGGKQPKKEERQKNKQRQDRQNQAPTSKHAASKLFLPREASTRGFISQSGAETSALEAHFASRWRCNPYWARASSPLQMRVHCRDETPGTVHSATPDWAAPGGHRDGTTWGAITPACSCWSGPRGPPGSAPENPSRRWSQPLAAIAAPLPVLHPLPCPAIFSLVVLDLDPRTSSLFNVSPLVFAIFCAGTPSVTRSLARSLTTFAWTCVCICANVPSTRDIEAADTLAHCSARPRIA